MNYIETCTKIAVFLWRSSNYRPLKSFLHFRPGWIIYQNMRETWAKKVMKFEREIPIGLQGIIFLVSHRNSRCIFSHLLRMFFYESQLLRCKRKHTCLRANSFTQMISTSEWPSRLAGPVICITQSHMKWSADKPHTVSARMHSRPHMHTHWSLYAFCM